MQDVFQYFKTWFRKAEKSTPSNPAIHEEISRGADYSQAFEHWKSAPSCRRLTDWLWQQYAFWKSLPDELDEAIDFLDTPSSKGFALHLSHTGCPQPEATFTLDFLKERVQALAYRCHLSDRRAYACETGMETIERHYLKPRLRKTDNQKLDQQFGNITIELVLRNGQPHQLRFRANAYTDRQYHPAQPFDTLFQWLVSEQG